MLERVRGRWRVRMAAYRGSEYESCAGAHAPARRWPSTWG